MNFHFTSFKLFLWLPALFFAFSATAQTPAPQKLTLQAKAIYDINTNEILLRWAPLDYRTWNLCNQNGYKVERITLAKENGEPLSNEDMLASQKIIIEDYRPVPEEEWETLADSNDMAGIVAGSIYGDSLEVLDLSNTDFMSIQNINRDRDNRFAFSLFACDQNFEVAKMAALAIKDGEIEPDYKYLYIIKPMNEPENYDIEVGTVIIEAVPPHEPPQPDILEVQPGDRVATIVWDRKKVEEYYTSFEIERLNSGTNTWESRNTRPFVSMISDGDDSSTMAFQDSLANNTTTFIYRIKGKTPFGVFGSVSDTVHVKGEPAVLIHAPSISNISETTTGGLKVEWAMQAGENNKVLKFEIYRSEENEGKYIFLDSVKYDTFNFTDNSPLRANYYIVKAKDLNGKYTTSFSRLGQPNDTEPPTAPQSLTGTCDKNGIVKLEWPANVEPDIWGYRVYTSNEGTVDTDFIQITPAVQPGTVFLYQISLATLTEDIFFKIKAVDFRENESEFSATCTVTRPDLIPPSAPVISGVRPRPAAVEFDWVASSSPDVVRYLVQKRQEQSPNWTNLFDFIPNTAVFTLTDSLSYLNPQTRRVWYQYRILAYDEAENVISSKILRAKPVETGFRSALRNFAGVFTPTTGAPGSGKVVLTWEADKDVDLGGFQIYRAIDTSKIRPFIFLNLADAVVSQNASGYVCKFEDFDMDFINFPVRTTFNQPPSFLGNASVTVQPGAINQPNNHQPGAGTHIFLHYQAAAIYADGGQSPLTVVVSVQIQ